MTRLEQIVQALYTKLSGVASLYVMRLRAFEESELPASNLVIDGVSPAERSVLGAKDWDLKFTVVSMVNGDAPFAALESRRSLVHTALMTDPRLGGVVTDISAHGFEIEPDPELPLVRMWQHFTLQYRNNSELEV
ncbi:MAG: hypothetical protein NT086_19820 [Proteobacteria bacterium]|nr:hypothetical protein [Pseudomonadota bacterium]